MNIFRKNSASRNQVHAEELHLEDHQHKHNHSQKPTNSQHHEHSHSKPLPKIENLYDIEQQDTPKGNLHSIF
jgi:hypothetical protein